MQKNSTNANIFFLFKRTKTHGRVIPTEVVFFSANEIKPTDLLLQESIRLHNSLHLKRRNAILPSREAFLEK